MVLEKIRVQNPCSNIVSLMSMLCNISVSTMKCIALYVLNTMSSTKRKLKGSNYGI